MSFLKQLKTYDLAPSPVASRRAIDAYEVARRDSAGQPEAITTVQTALDLVRSARHRSPEIEALEHTITIDLVALTKPA